MQEYKTKNAKALEKLKDLNHSISSKNSEIESLRSQLADLESRLGEVSVNSDKISNESRLVVESKQRLLDETEASLERSERELLRAIERVSELEAAMTNMDLNLQASQAQYSALYRQTKMAPATFSIALRVTYDSSGWCLLK